MHDPLQGLFSAAREAAEPRTWSRAVELQRKDAVDVLADGDSIELRVRVAGRTVAPSVTLHIADGEWSCTCDDDDPCEHVIASILALRQARREGRSLTRSVRSGADIGYRLTTDGDRVVVLRVGVRDGVEIPIEGTLGGLLSGRESGPAVEVTEVDLTIDHFLQQSRVRALAPDRFLLLMALLAQARDVRFDGRPISVSDAPLWPQVAVEQRARAFVLCFGVPPGDVVVVAPGVVCVDGKTLRPIGAREVVGDRLELLPCEQRFESDRIAELVTRVLPEWRERTVVDERTSLPETRGGLRVRPILEVSQRGAQLHVLASIGYGDPPVVRLVGDGLVPMRGAVVPIVERDPREERRATERLRELFDLAPGRPGAWTGREAIAMAARLREARGVAIFGDAHEVHYPSELQVELKAEGSRFEVSFSGSADGVRCVADPTAVVDAWCEGEAAVPLLGGGWAPLPNDWLERFGHRLRVLLAARDATGRIAPHGRPALAALCADLDHPIPADLSRFVPLARDFTGVPSATLPHDLRAELRPYQRSGIDWLCFLRDEGLGALLADDMGLGKTLQTIGALQGRALVVCPRSVVHNWIDEIQRFRPTFPVTVYHGPERSLAAEGVVVTTYALLRRDVEHLSAIDWTVAVLDEAQSIKNPDSQVAQAAFRLRAAFRVALSGTPVENRLEELWSLMHFCNPGLLGGRSDFRDTVERPIAEGDRGAAERLRSRIRPFLLRRTKGAVATDLPARSESLLTCELGPEERAIYDAVMLATRASVLEELEHGGSVMKALEALLRLRQAACDVALVPGQSLEREASSKVERLMLALEDAASHGHKALVFSQWTTLLDRVERELRSSGLRWSRLDGSTRDRAAVVREFQGADGPPVMLLSLKAGGTGLNLTAADHVFLLDPWWNPAAEDQAADRAHRIGQRHSVIVHRLIAKDTVEERILELQKRKRALAEVALDEGVMAAALTKDDLLALLG